MKAYSLKNVFKADVIIQSWFSISSRNSLPCHLKTTLQIKTLFSPSEFLSAKLLFQKIVPNLRSLYLKAIPTSRCYLMHFLNLTFDLPPKYTQICTCIQKILFCYKIHPFCYIMDMTLDISFLLVSNYFFSSR